MNAAPQAADRAKWALQQARIELVLDHPFFGALVLRLAMRPDPSCKTAWTDGKTIGYNPEFIAGLTPREVQGVLAHEVLHCANGHVWRREQREKNKWNRAADYAINPIVIDSGMQLPEGALVDQRFHGKAAEVIYHQLPDEVGCGGKNDSHGKTDGASGAAPSGGTGAEGPDSSTPGQAPAAPAQDGSGSGGGTPPVNDPGEGDYGPGAIRDPEPGTENTKEEADWRIATLQAAQAAKSQGRLPASLDRLVETVRRGRLDWRAILRRFVQQSARCDYSWRLPNTRFLGMGLYMPALRSEAMPPLVVAVDTSGSIGSGEIDSFAAEINTIIAETRPERTHIVYIDAKVRRADTFEPDDPVVLNPLGGGGTDFRPAFQWVTDAGIDPACLIYLTDLYGTFGETPPEYPVLWVSTADQLNAPWGETVHIDPT